MVKYSFSCDNPSQQYVSIKATFPVAKNKTIIRIPSWRPGRYELGNFAKNVKGFKIFDQDNKKVIFRKLSKDSWEIDTEGKTNIQVSYQYFAFDLNAGSTYLNSEQLYVNPVNCCVFSEDTFQDAIEVQLDIPRMI